jgi:hypothetical protein
LTVGDSHALSCERRERWRYMPRMRSSLALALHGIVSLCVVGCSILAPKKTAPVTEEKEKEKVWEASVPKEGGFPAAEPLLAKAAAKWAAASEHQITIKHTYTMGDDWGMLRNEESGVITGRTIRSVVFTKDDTNHKCWQLLCNLVQESQGEGKWGTAQIGCPGDLVLVESCESVDALPDRTAASEPAKESNQTAAKESSDEPEKPAKKSKKTKKTRKTGDD